MDFLGVTGEIQSGKMMTVETRAVTLYLVDLEAEWQDMTGDNATRVGVLPAKLSKLIGLDDAICNSNRRQVMEK